MILVLLALWFFLEGHSRSFLTSDIMILLSGNHGRIDYFHPVTIMLAINLHSKDGSLGHTVLERLSFPRALLSRVRVLLLELVETPVLLLLLRIAGFFSWLEMIQHLIMVREDTVAFVHDLVRNQFFLDH